MAENIQHGTQKGVPQRTNDDDIRLEAQEGEGRGAEAPEVETGVANDSGTVPGRKVDHRNPHDIPPRGMKRKY